MRKLPIIFIVMLVLMTSSALAFEFDGVTCSANPVDYVYYDLAPTFTTGHNYFNNTDVTSGTVTFYIDELTYTIANVEIVTANDDFSGLITHHFGQSNWYYHNGAKTDTGMAGTAGVLYNVTTIMDLENDKQNLTFASNTATSIHNDENFRSTGNNFERFDLEFISGATGNASGIYVWNGTSCPLPSGDGPEPSVTQNFDAVTLETDNVTHSLFVEFYNLTSSSTANLIFNGTNYTTDINFINESYAEFNTSLIMPLIEVNYSTTEFYWEYNLFHINASRTNTTTSPNTQTVEWKYFVGNPNYPDGVATSTAEFTFEANNSALATLNGYVEFNRTANYTATPVANVFTANVVLPTIEGFSQDFNVTGYVNVSYGGQDFVRQGEVEVQTTLSTGLFLCSATELTNATSLNVTFYDEETLVEVQASSDVSFTLNSTDSATQFTSEFALTGATSYELCVYPEDEQLFGDAYFEYSATGYDDRIYYLLDTLFTNETNYLNLYFVNTSSAVDVSFYVYDTSGNAVPDAYIDIQRYYPATSTYAVVETVKTDASGLAVASIILNDVTYKFNIDYNGATVYTTSGSPVYSTTNYFYINLAGAISTILLDENQISYYVNYSNTTDLFSYFFNDGGGNVQSGCLYVYQATTQGEQLLNYTCVDSSSATITYLLNQTSGTFIGRGYVYYSGGTVFLDSVTVYLGGLYKTLGNYGTILGVIVVGTFAFAGIFMAEVAIIMAMVGLIAAYFMGLIFLSKSILIALLIIAGIIIYKKT